MYSPQRGRQRARAVTSSTPRARVSRRMSSVKSAVSNTSISRVSHPLILRAQKFLTTRQSPRNHHGHHGKSQSSTPRFVIHGRGRSFLDHVALDTPLAFFLLFFAMLHCATRCGSDEEGGRARSSPTVGPRPSGRLVPLRLFHPFLLTGCLVFAGRTFNSG